MKNVARAMNDPRPRFSNGGVWAVGSPADRSVSNRAGGFRSARLKLGGDRLDDS